MTAEERAKSVEEAATKITEVLADLDTRSTVCEHCQMPRKSNWQDAKLSIQMHAIVQKLTNMAHQFRTNPTGEFRSKAEGI